uniref:Ataxin 2 SM domain-containing protein n=1 Tax=Salix viminalis TaxID=40686 RepID=A0A6N2KAZ3_SALVM
MGYRNRAEAETEACLNEALLFATMCILGLPVDVHVRDGSVYFGTFHTASFDKENGRGLFPADGVTANISGDNVEAAVTNAPSSEIVASEANKSNKFTADRKESNENRGSAKNKNGSSQGIMLTKAGKDHEERKMPPNDMGNAMEFEHGEKR